jgi:hypothetical protein
LATVRDETESPFTAITQWLEDAPAKILLSGIQFEKKARKTIVANE